MLLFLGDVKVVCKAKPSKFFISFMNIELILSFSKYGCIL
jgi:hypothetical protein